VSVEHTEIDWTTADQVFIKQIHIRQKDVAIPQHSHAYDHTSMLAIGRVRLWKDGVAAGVYSAPVPIFIAAGVKHLFLTETDETLIFCIHNATRPDVARVLEEHDLMGAF
jgi:quercetin dioxygenase-like cupin family protein